jgi:spore germination protein KC
VRERLWKSSVCLILGTILLAGCWDRREINDIAIVMGTAIDWKDGKYQATVQFPLPGQMGGVKGGGGGTRGNKSWYLDSSTGTTLDEVIRNQQQSISRLLYFAHRRVLLIGEEMADRGVAPVIDIVARVPQNRLSAYFIVAKGEARAVLNADAPVEQIPSEMIRELTTESMNNPRTIRHVIESILSDGIDPAVPFFTFRTTETGNQNDKQSTIRLEGLAVFKGDKLAGFMRGEKAQGVLWAMGEVKRPRITIPSPNGNGLMSLQFAENAVTIKPILENDEFTIRLHIKARGTVVENGTNYSSMSHGIPKIEQTANVKIKTLVEDSISELQKKYHSDAVGFGDAIHRDYNSRWQALRKNWVDEYEKLKVDVQVQVQIEHTGTIVVPMAEKKEDIADD